MDGLNDLAPAIVGAVALAYIWLMLFRIKRGRAKSRGTSAAE